MTKKEILLNKKQTKEVIKKLKRIPLYKWTYQERTRRESWNSHSDRYEEYSTKIRPSITVRVRDWFYRYHDENAGKRGEDCGIEISGGKTTLRAYDCSLTWNFFDYISHRNEKLLEEIEKTEYAKRNAREKSLANKLIRQL